MRFWFVKRDIRPAEFCLIVLGLAFVLFALPYPSVSQVKRIGLIETKKAPFVILGPSTIDHVSICDTDRRTIPDMLSSAVGAPVLDLSVGGQPLADTINLAAVSGTKAWTTDIILPLVHPQIDDWTTPTYRELLVYKAMDPGFRVFAAKDFNDFWSGLAGKPRPLEIGYKFEGRSYPDYRELAAHQFSDETRLAGCPETGSHDPVFTRSYFWWTQVARGRNESLYQLIADLNTDLVKRGKRLHVVVMPTNLDLIGQMDPAWPGIVEDQQKDLLAALAQRGVNAIDLSTGFGEDEFSTPWCACIHLNEKGRAHLVQAMVTKLLPSASATADR